MKKEERETFKRDRYLIFKEIIIRERLIKLERFQTRVMVSRNLSCFSNTIAVMYIGSKKVRANEKSPMPTTSESFTALMRSSIPNGYYVYHIHEEDYGMRETRKKDGLFAFLQCQTQKIYKLIQRQKESSHHRNANEKHPNLGIGKKKNEWKRNWKRPKKKSVCQGNRNHRTSARRKGIGFPLD